MYNIQLGSIYTAHNNNSVGLVTWVGVDEYEYIEFIYDKTDFLHKLSTRLIRENQTIVLEDLNTSGMLKNRKLSHAISDLGWRSFRTMLEAKAEMYGRDFRVISRWEPTSQRCSCCGQIGGKKELSVRE